jgi:hypothetical protein
MIKEAEHKIRRNNRSEQHKQANNAPSHLGRTVLSLRNSARHPEVLPIPGKLTRTDQ